MDLRLWRKRSPEQADERNLSWPDTSRPPSWLSVSQGPGYSPLPVTTEGAVGLPAVAAAIRLVSETLASLPMDVFRGHGADKRLADDTWQYDLLHELPGMGDFTPFDFYSDLVACVESSGNAFIQKVKAAGRVIALIVMDPGRVEVTRENGQKTFAVWDRETGQKKTYTTSTILHIRGFTIDGCDEGLSPIRLHTTKLGAIMAKDQYEGRFYGQGMGSRVAVEYPGQMDEEQQLTFMRRWKGGNTGLQNAHVPLLLTNGAQVKPLGMSLEDAQWVESEKLNLIQVANIFGLPASALGAEAPQNPEQETLKLYRALQSRIRRIEYALRCDPDIFPDRELYPEADVSHLIRTDAKTAAEVEHFQIQDGLRTVDEIRADHGWPPHPPLPENPLQTPGSIPQVTPVGGAPNPVTDPTGD